MTGWVSTSTRLPGYFEGSKLFQCKVVNNQTKQETDCVVHGSHYPTGFRFSINPGHAVTQWYDQAKDAP